MTQAKKPIRSGRLPRAPSFAYYLLHTGFQVFKKRLREELVSTRGLELDECADDECLYPLYQRGESMNYVMERLCGTETGAEKS